MLATFIAVNLLWLCATAPAEARILHSSKSSLKLLKTSSSSLLHQSTPLHPQGRYKRDADDENEYYDENFDVIPVMSGGESPKTVGDHLSEQGRKIAESFSSMWQAVAESVKRCVDAIRELFAGDDGGAIVLTPEEEEQMRAAMEAREKALEEQNEIYRNFQENQL